MVGSKNGTSVPEESYEHIKGDAEKFLIGSFKLANMAGKGRQSVPILIHVDAIEANS